MTRATWIGLTLAFIAVAALALALYILRTFGRYRAIARQQFADFVRRQHPELEILSQGPPTVRLRRSDGEIFTIDPHALYIRIKLAHPAANEDLYEKLLSGYDVAAALKDKDAGA
jgi:hypothetical protein